jgi:hypothetical protein
VTDQDKAFTEIDRMKLGDIRTKPVTLDRKILEHEKISELNFLHDAGKIISK